MNNVLIFFVILPHNLKLILTIKNKKMKNTSNTTTATTINVFGILTADMLTAATACQRAKVEKGKVAEALTDAQPVTVTDILGVKHSIVSSRQAAKEDGTPAHFLFTFKNEDGSEEELNTAQATTRLHVKSTTNMGAIAKAIRQFNILLTNAATEATNEDGTPTEAATSLRTILAAFNSHISSANITALLEADKVTERKSTAAAAKAAAAAANERAQAATTATRELVTAILKNGTMTAEQVFAMPSVAAVLSRETVEEIAAAIK